MIEEAPSPFRGSRIKGGCFEVFVGRTVCVVYLMPATLKKVSTLRPSEDTQGRVRPRGVMCSVTTFLEVLARNCAAAAEAGTDLCISGFGVGVSSSPLEKSRIDL